MAKKIHKFTMTPEYTVIKARTRWLLMRNTPGEGLFIGGYPTEEAANAAKADCDALAHHETVITEVSF